MEFAFMASNLHLDTNRPTWLKTKLWTWLRMYWFFVFPAGFALLAAAIMVYDMKQGPWAFSDSAAYVSAARNLVLGHGLSVSNPSGSFSPLTLHQPFYPLVLSFFLLFGIHPFTTTTVINIFSYSLSTLIVGSGTYYFSRSKVLTLVLLAVLIITPDWINNFDGAMSEPLFLFLSIATFFGLLLYLDTGKIWILYSAGLLAGLSLLTRYIGLVNILLGLSLILLTAGDRWKEKLKLAVSFTGSAVLPFALWIVVSRQPASSSRQMVFPPDLFKSLRNFVLEFQQTISGWLPVPDQHPLSPKVQDSLFLIVTLILIVGAIFLLRRRRRVIDPKQRLALLLPLSAGLFCILYTFMILAAYLFSSLPPDINNRTLIPLLVFWWIMIASALVLIPAGKKMMGAAMVFLVIYAVYAINILYPISKEMLYDRRHYGLGYTAKYFQESTLLKAARSLPLDVPWIANDPALYLLYLNKFPYDLTTIYNRFDQKETLPFGEGNTKLDKLFREDGAYLLLHQPQFERDLRSRYGDVALKKVKSFTADLGVLDDSDDGQVYYWLPPLK